MLASFVQSMVSRTKRYRDVIQFLESIDVEETLSTPQNKASVGLEVIVEHDADGYSVQHVIENGIERITYTPHNQTQQTPIMMMHGMWHGAWCWEQWQELFAGCGWQSVAFSLPGHAGSPMQKPMTEITLDYYLTFLRDEMQRISPTPILMGHSMGGAISQWYLRYVSDDLPAVVLVGSWVHDSSQREGFKKFFQLDPVGVLLVGQAGDATPFVRSPQQAAKKLITEHSIYTPEELHAKLGPESTIVTMQHNPPMWKPADNIRAPLLYVAGERDALISPEAGKATADHYNGDYLLVPDAGHNLMMDAHHDEVAEHINEWLQGQNIP